jgi:phosphatidate cytidylyltransferase
MLAVFIFGNPIFMRVFFTLLVGISAYETAHMILPRLYRVMDPVGQRDSPIWLNFLVVGIACAIFALSSAGQGLEFVILGLLGSLLLGLFIAPEIDLAFASGSGIVVCVVYGVFPWLAIWELYQLAPDSRYIFMLCAIVWSGDTGAYFAGRRFGKHKLAPRMSPNKTWEGSLGGIVASLIAALVLKSWYADDLVSWKTVLACALVGGSLGQLGDLAESTFKRFSGVKDSGNIFPGHGGFLDRVDGLLFAAPAVWFILIRFGMD